MNITNTFKNCSNCGRQLALENFHVNRKSKDGFQSNCKKCQNKIMKSNMRVRRAEQKLEATRKELAKLEKQYLTTLNKLLESNTQDFAIKKLPDMVSDEFLPRVYVRKRDGYVLEMENNRGLYFLQHALVIQRKYNIYSIPRHCEIHHKDFVRQHNTEENLILMNKDDHKKLHRWYNANPSRKTSYTFEEACKLAGVDIDAQGAYLLP